mmetsp:Transcript_46430/g.111679  ORF Transcript_46430/g.111679 Transcript_46430/m.111679 type:complete len:268 (-) Transcript_46430:28-831(-)
MTIVVGEEAHSRGVAPCGPKVVRRVCQAGCRDEAVLEAVPVRQKSVKRLTEAEGTCIWQLVPMSDYKVDVAAQFLRHARGETRVGDDQPDLARLVQRLEDPFNQPVLHKRVARPHQQRPVLPVRGDVNNIRAVLMDHVDQVSGPLGGIHIVNRNVLLPQVFTPLLLKGCADLVALLPHSELGHPVCVDPNKENAERPCLLGLRRNTASLGRARYRAARRGRALLLPRVRCTRPRCDSTTLALCPQSHHLILHLPTPPHHRLSRRQAV